MVTDVNKITVKKLPGLTIEYKQDTRSLLNSKEEKAKKPAKVYYAVRNGRKVGVYESLEEAQNQVKGVSGSEWKKFKNLEDANKYIEEGPAKVYYAVRNGRKVGVYESLEEAQNQVKGVSGSEWKKFKNLEDANKYIEEGKFYKGKCYVVVKGRKPGIYKNYELAREQTDGSKIMNWQENRLMDILVHI